MSSRRPLRLRPSLRVARAIAALAIAGCAGTPEGGERRGAVEFEGNETFDDDDLRGALAAELDRVDRSGFSKSAIDDLADELGRYLRDQGFPFASVDYAYEPARAVLRIREGPRIFVAGIRFTGVRVFPPGELEDLLPARRLDIFGLGQRLYIARDIEGLRGSIEDAYRERGYHEVEVARPMTAFSLEDGEAAIAIGVAEGRPYVVREVRFAELPVIDHAEARARCERYRGAAHVARTTFEIRTALERLYADRGHPFAAVAVTESIAEGPDRVDVDLEVRATEGPAIAIKDVVVRGNVETDVDFILSRLVVRPGDRYDGSAVRRSYTRLFMTGLFKSVRIELAGGDREGASGGTSAERDCIVQVEEKPTTEYFGELGFGSYDLLRGRVGVREINLFGQGTVGRAEVLGSIRGVQATLGVTDPFFLQSEWTLDAPITALYREEPSFTMAKGEVGVRFSRKIAESIAVGGAYRFSLSDVKELEVESTFDEEPNLIVGALGPFLERTTWDDLFAPTSGARTRLFAEVGAPALGGEIAFFHGGAATSHVLEIFDGTVIAARAELEWIQPFGSTDSIPIQERLFNGGESTVRSFKQSELGPRDASGEFIGGEVKNTVSLELRQRIMGELSCAAFGDWGNVALTAAKPLDDFRPAVGFGLRYGLPVGPVRLDVGFNPDRRPEEDLYVIHVAIGMPF